MLTFARRNLYPDYTSAQSIRHDFFRSGATIGGTGEGAVGATTTMLVNGSVTPVPYAFGPGAGEVFVIERVVFGLICLTNPGPLEFGSLGNPLPNGILFRIYRAAGAASGVPETTNLFTLLSNSDLMYFGQRNIQDDLTNAFIVATWTPTSADMPLALIGAQEGGVYGDQLQMIISDDCLAGTINAVAMWAYCHAHVMT